MGAHKVDLCLGNGSHPDLVKGTGEESRKGRHKHDVAVAATETDPDSHHILLGDEALYESLWAAVFVGDGERGVLCVSVESYDSGVVLPQLHQSLSVRLPCGNLDTRNALEILFSKIFHRKCLPCKFFSDSPTSVNFWISTSA